jgi:hypothetical protein
VEDAGAAGGPVDLEINQIRSVIMSITDWAVCS